MHQNKFIMFSVIFVTVLILTLCVSNIEATSSVVIPASFSAGHRSILQSIGGDGADKSDYAVELNAADFDAVLKETPATYAIVEFFANWCPACRNYKPHYEKVAKLFNGADAVHPGIILMTRVDCAVQVNTNLCDKFSVGHYPMLLWGPHSKFVSGSWDPENNTSEIRSINDARTADQLLNWINKQINSSYSLDDEKYEHEHLRANASDLGQIARAIYDVEEATFTAFDIILEHKMIKSENRASLIKFFQLLVVHHPSRRCRKGTAEILVDFDDFAAKKETAVVGEQGAFRNFKICGKDVPRGNWMFCRGSKNETRGFSCGLWVLLHSLSVRVDDGESHLAFTTICDFIRSFFICEECRQHFSQMCSSVSNPFKKSRDFVLWLWITHNKVNERLMKEEASAGTADPKFPKIIWPPSQLCPSCYLRKIIKNDRILNSKINWDFDEVYKFLIGYYGEKLETLHKDEKNLLEDEDEELIVVVPIEAAALAIAIVSCLFGAVACYWRRRQKFLKHKYYLHSLKSI
ncbi:hypothetical protein ABFS83_05G040800 [Erythranthe nasuta]